MKRKSAVLIAMLLAVCFSLAASAPAAPASEPAAATAAQPAEKKNIKFYGKIVEYASGEATCLKLEELIKDRYQIESLQVDWGNLAQVIRTGIASGAPCDIYNYWPMYIRTFSDVDMCLDLTPYLDADNGAWRSTFDENMLSLGTVDGKIYGVPTTPNFSWMIANVELFKQAGMAAPRAPTGPGRIPSRPVRPSKPTAFSPLPTPPITRRGPGSGATT